MSLLQSTSQSECVTCAGRKTTLDLESLKLQIFTAHDLTPLRDDWQQLESNSSGNAYHAFEWCKSWVDHVATCESASPLIIAGYIGEELHVLLPFALHHSPLVKTARWLGTEIFNQNTGYWSQHLLSAPQAHFLRPRLTTLLKSAGVDLIQLSNMTCKIGTYDNPLIRRQDSTSANAIYPFKLAKPAASFVNKKRSKSARKKHRSKLSKLQALGQVELSEETTQEGAVKTISAMISQREIRQAETGIPTAFSLPAYQKFIGAAFRGLALENSPTKPVIYNLKLNTEIISTCLSLKSGARLYCYCTSITSGDLMRFSPGELLMQQVIEDMCEQGMEVFDFGLGEERFKLAWAEPEYLKDWLEPLTLRGKVAASLQSIRCRLKRKLRNNEKFWKQYRRLRAMFARLKR